MAWVGIDPGKSGGIARITDFGVVEAWKMPETERDIWDLVRFVFPSTLGLAVIERVHSMPKQGVVSSFTFGRNYGSLRMALIGWNVPFEEVTPQRWMKALGCLTGGDKHISKARAQQMFPTVKVTNATADALLLAEYARRLRHGGVPGGGGTQG